MHHGISQNAEGSRILDTNLSHAGSTTMAPEHSRNKLSSPKIEELNVKLILIVYRTAR